MKYWIFQNNQVLGPYEPNDMSSHPAFTAESLVCPEGRRGTSMGDWQRAGMVPDLSVALVKAAQAHSVRSPVATLAGLPPEPTLKDLAVLGSLQEKMAMLEDVVLQLQEGLRTKDSELAALHEELAGKDRESAAMKRESSEIKREADELKHETEAQRREAEALKAESEQFKRKVSELEERVGAVNRLSDTIDKAVAAEKHVEHDVEAQGATLAELAKEMEALRAQLHERLTAAVPAPAAPEPASMPSIAPMPVDAPMPSIAPPPADAPMPSIAPTPMPAFESAPLPSFGSSASASAVPLPMPGFDAPAPAPVPSADAAALEAVASAAPAAETVPAVDAAPAPAPAKGGSKKGLLFGATGGLLALAALALYSGRLTKRKPSMPPVAADTAPLPTPPPAPVQPPPPPPDPRDAAIAATKGWTLADGRTLGSVLEAVSPPSGNLSPWMAEPLPNDRALVNYFAHGAAGAPTVAYEFEVDLAAKTVAGRNAAAKAALAGKAAPPPPPAKPRKVKVTAKAKPKPAAPKPEDNLDSILGAEAGDKSPAPIAAPAAPRPKAEPKIGDAPEDAPSLDKAPPSAPEAPAEEAPAPAKPTAAKRAAKAAGKQPAAKGKAADEALLDDLLKE